MFIILNWPLLMPEDVGIVTNSYGEAMIFDTYEEAEEYAKKELNFEWKVVELL